MPETTDYEKVSQAKERLQKALDRQRAAYKKAGKEIMPWDEKYLKWHERDQKYVLAPRGSMVEVLAADIVTVCESTPGKEDDKLFNAILNGSKDAIAPSGDDGPKADPLLAVVVPFSNVEWLLSQAGG